MARNWRSRQFRRQPAERWVMYRLVMPIVDEACALNGLESYFEYFKPNGPNRRLSVDIALVDGNERPIWMIEAKKISRTLNPGFVTPYLTRGEMGVVSNGEYWVFCIDGETTTVGPILDADGYIIPNEVDRIVSTLFQVTPSDAKAALNGWKTGWSGYNIENKQNVWRLGKGTVERVFAKKMKTDSLQEAVGAILATSTAIKPETPLEKFLLMLQERDIEIPEGYIEFSVSRLVWRLADGRRGFRILLSGKQLEMLIHSDIVGSVGEERITAQAKMHDKNDKMILYKASTDAELASLLAIFTGD